MWNSLVPILLEGPEPTEAIKILANQFHQHLGTNDDFSKFMDKYFPVTNISPKLHNDGMSFLVQVEMESSYKA